MTIEAILLDDRRHAVVVLSGRPAEGCGTDLVTSLQVCSRSHTIVDLRQVSGFGPDLVKALLAALGRALDRGRTVRLVVRDHRQHQAAKAVGVGTMMPVHLSIAEAMDAVDAAITADRAAVAPRRR